MKNFFLTAVLGLLALFGVPTHALANSCASAASQGTAPADYKDYCWLDFSGYNDATALSAGGQAFSFTLPDLSTLSMTVNTTKVVGNGDPAVKTVPVPSYSGAAFGNTAFIGIPGQTILYSGTQNSTVKVTLSNITVARPAGAGTGIAKYAIVVGDGESTDGTETLSFTTNGDGWTQLAKIAGSGANYPAVTGLGTTTVTENGAAAPVGSYVFGTFNNPTQISGQFKGAGLQGFIVGVRYASISVVSQITGVRYNAPDQFTYAVKTSSGTSMTSGSTSGTAVNGFTPASLPTVAASYPFVIDEVMAGGSTGTLANYTVSLTCTNANAASTTVLPSNVAQSSYTIPSLAYGDSVKCVFTNKPIFSPVSGTVYSDANHNFVQDGSETGTGVAGLYVKLAASSGGVCQSPASTSAAVNSSTGAFSLPAVAPGNYCLILDTNNTLSDITSNPPAGWLGTENASGVIQIVVESAPPEPPFNFGLFNGSKLSGTVFSDTGTGAGTANNGVKDGSEAGIASVTVNANSGASVAASAATTGDGSYTLWVPASVTGTVVITPILPSGYAATGGSAGTTGGSYSNPSVSYAPTTGLIYTGVNFGAVPPNTLAANGAQTGKAGTAVFYPHTYYAGSGGQLTFSLTNSPIPTSPAWTQVLYQDTTCSGAMSPTSPQITASLAVTAGQTVCVIVKQFVPAGALLNAKNVTTLSASLSYTGATPLFTSLLSVTDETTVGTPSALSLAKRVGNITRSLPAALNIIAQPGDVLEYTLTATNNGTEALNTLVINDATPAFSTHVSSACPAAALPASLTACTISQQPAVGASGNVQWSFTGTLAPSSQLAVTYRIKVNP